MTTRTRSEAERVCGDWVRRVGSSCEATPVKVGEAWYMVTSGTGDAPHFAYDVDDVADWLATREGQPLYRYADDDTTEYGDFCASALIQCVEDEPTALALLDEGFRVHASGTCNPVIAEEARDDEADGPCGCDCSPCTTQERCLPGCACREADATAARLRDMLRDIADVAASGPNPHLRAMIADAIAEADRLAGDS